MAHWDLSTTPLFGSRDDVSALRLIFESSRHPYIYVPWRYLNAGRNQQTALVQGSIQVVAIDFCSSRLPRIAVSQSNKPGNQFFQAFREAQWRVERCRSDFRAGNMLKVMKVRQDTVDLKDLRFVAAILRIGTGTELCCLPVLPVPERTRGTDLRRQNSPISSRNRSAVVNPAMPFLRQAKIRSLQTSTEIAH